MMMMMMTSDDDAQGASEQQSAAHSWPLILRDFCPRRKLRTLSKTHRPDDDHLKRELRSAIFFMCSCFIRRPSASRSARIGRSAASAQPAHARSAPEAGGPSERARCSRSPRVRAAARARGRPARRRKTPPPVGGSPAGAGAAPCRRSLGSPLLASLRKLLRVYCLLCEGGVQQLTLWAVGTSICHHLRVRSSLSLARLSLRRRRPVRGGSGGILRGPRENAGKTRPEPLIS